MKISALIFAPLVSLSASALPAMEWNCIGSDPSSGAQVNFTLLLLAHDGEKYAYQAMEDMIYDGKPAPSKDLTQTCGERVPWSLDVESGQFSYSDCGNEATKIVASCMRMF